MTSWRNSQAVSAVCLPAGKLAWMLASSAPPNGGLVSTTSTRCALPIWVIGVASALPRVMLGWPTPCRTRFIIPSR